MMPEDILRMEGGEELNRLVAREVMEGREGRYSEDICEAWLIADRLVSLGWRVDILYSRGVVNVNALKIIGGRPYSLYAKYGSIYASTAPEALCKIGLLAMIVEKEGW